MSEESKAVVTDQSTSQLASQSASQSTEQKAIESLNTTNTTSITNNTTNTTSPPINAPVNTPVQSGVNPDVRRIDMFTLEEALKLVCEYYNTVFPNLECFMPAQIVEGGVVEFADGGKNVILATARTRFVNASHVVNGSVYVEVKFASLAFVRQKHTLKMQLVEPTVQTMPTTNLMPSSNPVESK